MKIKGNEIEFTILPRFDKVYAEIYEEHETGFHIQLLSKEFGSIFRKPIEKDYLEARKWVDMQLKCIKNANN